MADFPLGGIEIQDNDISSVDLFDTLYGPAVYAPIIAAPPTGQNGLTDPAGLVLARAAAGVNLVPWDPTIAVQLTPVAVLGSGVVNPDPAVVIDLTSVIISGQVRREKLVYFDVATGTYLALSTLDGAGDNLTPEEAYDQLRQTGIIARQVTELSRFDNPNNP